MSSLYMRMLGNNALSEQGNRAFLSLAEVTQACRTLRGMNFLAEAYIDTHLMSLGTEGAATAPVSRTERLRVLRALYRRQIICNAWAPTRREPEWNERDTAAIGNTSSHRQVRLGLFAAFEPWELQQVDHIDFFVTRMCRALYFSRQEAAQPMSEAEFGEIFSQIDYLVQYMQKHPNIAKAALRTVQSPPRLTNYEPHNATYHRFADRYSLLCMHFSWQSYRLETFPDPMRDRRGQQADSNEARFGFIGDAVDLVPFGWTDALNRRYVNWFGDALLDMTPWMPESDADEELRLARYASLGLWRNAGFALWDKKRVEALKEVDSLRTLSTGWLDY
ncbi:uncharacterized protein E0L32_012300 [Thyridium curvatum]|uniref:Uncharacterized protein n=1 Tax=Thyridium curvatum TaxID=1093900 RepID=A0A507BBZ7_9PEZI|nr:uncharacterized protein E0L32_012300 [Thyridium curvatum]TPX17043.1 hypothetical protein E0L32_012300 [Thyridium curvatum]